MRRMSSLLLFLILPSLSFPCPAQTVDNHLECGPPGSVQGTGTFGVITNTNTDNRELQLALKYIF
jgi:hypothetical protein